MINLKKDKKILGCFFNGERIVDILNHKGESMLDFSGTLNHFTNLPTAYGQIGTEEKNALAEEYEKNGIYYSYYYFSNNFDLKSKYPLDLKYMIEQDNLGVFERTSPKFNIKLYKILFQRYFFYENMYNEYSKNEITKDEFKTLFKISFDFDFEKAKEIKEIFFRGNNFYLDKVIILLKNVHSNIIKNSKIKELVYDCFQNPDFYIEKYELVKEDVIEQTKLNTLEYIFVKPIYHRNIEEDVFVIKIDNYHSSYNNANIHIANKTSNEVTLEVCFLEADLEAKEEFNVPANSNDYVININSSGRKSLYFIRRKDGKLLNNKYHTNGWVKLF